MAAEIIARIERLIGQDMLARDAAFLLGLKPREMAAIIREKRHTNYRGLKRMVQQRRLNNLLSTTMPSMPLPALPLKKERKRNER